MSSKSRALPAVAAAMIAAGGVVWVMENSENPNVGTRTRRDDDRTIRAELHTTSEAVFVLVANSGWRGRIAEVNRSISRYDVVDIFAAPGEPVEIIILGEQDASRGRQTVRCKIIEDGKTIEDKQLIVRTGETKTVKCHKSL